MTECIVPTPLFLRKLDIPIRSNATGVDDKSGATSELVLLLLRQSTLEDETTPVDYRFVHLAGLSALRAWSQPDNDQRYHQTWSRSQELRCSKRH